MRSGRGNRKIRVIRFRRFFRFHRIRRVRPVLLSGLAQYREGQASACPGGVSRRHTGKMPVPRRAAQVWCLACAFRRSKYLSLSHARTTRKQKAVPCLFVYSVCFVVKNPSNKKSLRLCASALNNPEPCPKNLGVHGVLAVPKARAALLFSRLRATAWSQQERLTRDLRLATCGT